MSKDKRYTNNLINESSPYLLQHAHNPVNWESWNKNTLQRAFDEDKMILISIGYSSCHWCHVMEKESFENETLAQLMNDFFICIKIDREERPDIDLLYMQAIQLMGQNGGWPLNCFCLPDTRPIYGGTYFRPEQWRNVLISLIDLKNKERDRLIEYADKLEKGIKQLSELPVLNENKQWNKEEYSSAVIEWVKTCDFIDGGPNYAPKFPMPVNYAFLLNYGCSTKDNSILNFVKLTLDKMCRGGIYDQIGGGFSRYSVDGYWKIPHFEKMLYDNAQLIELYSKGYRLFKSEEYKNTVYQTIEFLESDLKSENGLFYSALDADSEGVEGKYYTWTLDELKEITKSDFNFLQLLYNKDHIGFWENDLYVLMRKQNLNEIAAELNLDINQLNIKVSEINQKLLFHRNKRIKPGLDHKCLLSWNALLVNGLIEAYISFKDENLLRKAENLIESISIHFLIGNEFFRVNTNNTISTKAFCEDYSILTNAYINLYLATSDTKYIKKAIDLQKLTDQLFLNTESGFYNFNPIKQIELIANKADTNDNVIPSSNAFCALNNFFLYKITGDNLYYNRYLKIIKHVFPYFIEQPAGYALFGKIIGFELLGFKEIVIAGPQSSEYFHQLHENYHANCLITHTNNSTEYLFKSRLPINETLIYVCENNTCKQSTKNIKEALEII
jgi:uncharacterized protein YyaL (SSP411 family)